MLLNLFLYCDVPERWQFGFQDPATPVVEGMHSFHNYLTFFGILVVAVFVFFMLFVTIVYFREGLAFFSILKYTLYLVKGGISLLTLKPKYILGNLKNKNYV